MISVTFKSVRIWGNSNWIIISVLGKGLWWNLNTDRRLEDVKQRVLKGISCTNPDNSHPFIFQTRTIPLLSLFRCRQFLSCHFLNLNTSPDIYNTFTFKSFTYNDKDPKNLIQYWNFENIHSIAFKNWKRHKPVFFVQNTFGRSGVNAITKHVWAPPRSFQDLRCLCKQTPGTPGSPVVL